MASLLSRLAEAVPSRPDLVHLATALMHCVAQLVAGNSANKLSLREAGAFPALAALMDSVLAHTPRPPAANAASQEQADG